MGGWKRMAILGAIAVGVGVLVSFLLTPKIPWRSRFVTANRCGMVLLLNSADWPTTTRYAGGTFVLTGHPGIYRTETLTSLDDFRIEDLPCLEPPISGMDNEGNVYLPVAPNERVEVHYLHLNGSR